MTTAHWLDITKRIIEAADYCVLITSGDSGWANARLMQPFQPEEDWTIWFGASPRSRKVREIEANPQATVTYQDDREHAYVTLLGQARVERDLEARRRHWRVEWAMFWPEGPGSDDYVLIQFVPSRIELMNLSRRVAPGPRTRPAVLVREGEEWVPG
jgi:general stress protein 26